MQGTEPAIQRYGDRAIIALEEAMVQIVEVGVDGHPVFILLQHQTVEAGVPQRRVECRPLHKVKHVDRVGRNDE